MKNNKEFKYGMAVSNVEKPKPRKRLPQYDECLNEFLKSEDDIWQVKADAFQARKSKLS